MITRRELLSGGFMAALLMVLPRAAMKLVAEATPADLSAFDAELMRFPELARWAASMNAGDWVKLSGFDDPAHDGFAYVTGVKMSVGGTELELWRPRADGVAERVTVHL